MARRGLKCAVAVVPKTIDNDVPVIDKSFGFATAAEAAVPHIVAAATEAAACPNGVGVVKLMGRHSGFIAMHATLASGDVDLCLIPESEFDVPSILDHVERKLRKHQHALVVVAEGAGQTQMGAEGRVDASGNTLNEDVGPWLKKTITDHFASPAYDGDADFGVHRAKVFFVDPTYTIRACAANAQDQVYCSSLAHAAVHGAMAGYTRFLVGNVNTRLALLPLDLVVNRRNIVSIRDRMWTRLLFSTPQPPFEAAAGHGGEGRPLAAARRPRPGLHRRAARRLLRAMGVSGVAGVLGGAAARASRWRRGPLVEVREQPGGDGRAFEAPRVVAEQLAAIVMGEGELGGVGDGGELVRRVAVRRGAGEAFAAVACVGRGGASHVAQPNVSQKKRRPAWRSSKSATTAKERARFEVVAVERSARRAGRLFVDRGLAEQWWSRGGRASGSKPSQAASVTTGVYMFVAAPGELPARRR
ncbi:6-phosphofructokinase [Aureococcus anophagefferens]|nr:6-phosphofructokinase [Aureococcus anophagefferens]